MRRVDAARLAAAHERVEALRADLVDLDERLGEACREFAAAGGSWYDLAERFGRSWNVVYYAYSGKPVPPSVTLSKARTVPVVVAGAPRRSRGALRAVQPHSA